MFNMHFFINIIDGNYYCSNCCNTQDQRKFHVFMLNSYSKFARRVVCEVSKLHTKYYISQNNVICITNQASKRGYTYPHYGWIVFGWYTDKWWTEESAGEHIDECTDQEIEEFLEQSRALVIHLLPEPDDYNLITDAGIVSAQFITVLN